MLLRLTRKSSLRSLSSLYLENVYATQPITLINCAKMVAVAAPAGPMRSVVRKKISSPILSAVEIIRNMSGVTESPYARRMPQMKL